MASLSAGIAVLSLALCFRDVGTVSRDVKCTGNDPRQTYPYCMFGRESKTLWCDQSTYRKIPSVPEINAHLYDVDCITAKALFVNDSCLQEIDRVDLQPYREMRIFLGGQNYVKGLKDQTFDGNQRLEEIDLCDNDIQTLEQGSLIGLKGLKKLRLDNNRISLLGHHLLKDLHQLEKLSMENNFLAEIDNRTFRRQRSLKILNLKGNIIATISDFTFVKNVNLRHLHLDGNRIEIISVNTFAGLEGLEILTVSHNRIKIWPEEYGILFHNVHTLHLGSNQLQKFEPSHTARMSSLQNLLLDNNSLSTIHQDLFRSTPRLAHLNLSANRLEDIPEDSFSGLCHLESLILTKNNLRTPRSKWFHHLVNRASEMTYTDISDNQWNCDCDIRKFKEFIDALKRREDITSKILSRKLEIRCMTPKFANSLVLTRNVTTEIEFRLGCSPVTAAASNEQVAAADSHVCDGRAQLFKREYLDLRAQFIPREFREFIPVQSTTPFMKTKDPGPEPAKGVRIALPIICAVAILGVIIGWLACRNIRSRRKGSQLAKCQRQDEYYA